jgi:protein ImuB
VEIVLDLGGLRRLFGDARTIAEELRRTAADRGLRVRVAVAATRTAARLMVRHRAGIAIVEPGTEADAVAPLPVALLATLHASHLPPTPNVRTASNDRVRQRHETNDANEANELIATLRRWGVRTCGAFAALAADAVAARLGQDGVAWQRLARGEDPRPLVPAVVEERFEQAIDLEWPIEGLEPLSFVLGRLMEPLEAHLERRDRGAAVLHVRLRLVTREVHERSLELPAPIRDARTLRTLALLDLESHPPAAAIDRVTVAVDPTPGRVVQFSLLTRPLPTPEQLSTLMARLTALMGEGRCGAPVAVDSWQPGALAMKPFNPGPGTADSGLGARGSQRAHSSRGADDLHTTPDSRPQYSESPVPSLESPAMALRRFRCPIPVRVRAEDGTPLRVTTDRRGLSGGPVTRRAGPWRTSGAWWSDRAATWDRDEWDVTLPDGTYRLFRERATDHWFIEGVVD